MRFLVFCLFTVIAVMADAKAQDPETVKQKIDAIAAKLQLNDNLAVPADLFMHLDKNVYVSNEQIWFAAYLLNSHHTDESHTVHAVLVNDMTQQKIASSDYALQNGMASGGFLIPGNLQTGAYSFMGYTNDYPASRQRRFFRQSIYVYGAEDPPYSLIFTSMVNGDSLVISGKVVARHGERIKGKLAYSLFCDGALSATSLVAIHDAEPLQIATTLPLDLSTVEILGTLMNGKDTMHFRRPVTGMANEAQLQFFPENGQLVQGQPGKVYFELKDPGAKGISTNLSLWEDEVKVSDFSSNVYGHGIFQLTPAHGKSYSVKTRDDNKLPLQNFPPIQKDATWTLQADNIIADSLQLRLAAASPGNQCILFIHNNREMLYSSYIQLPGKEGVLRLPAKDWPAGIAMISLYDDNGNLQTQKAVLVREGNPVLATVQLDSANYHPLSKVTVRVSLKDAQGSPVTGRFSFAAVPTQALNVNSADIERYDLFDCRLPAAIRLPPPAMLNSKPQLVHTLAMIAGKITPAISVSTQQPAPQTLHDGRVLYRGKPLKKPINLLLLGSSTHVFSTTQTGAFVIPYTSLTGSAGSRVLLSVANNPTGYEILMNDPLKETDEAIAKQYFMPYNSLQEDLSVAEKQAISSTRSISLAEVTVSAKSKGPKGIYGTINSNGNCNDYVCRLGFLNCLSHPRGEQGTQQAVDGSTYLIDGINGTEEVLYHCEHKGMPPYIKSLPAVALPQDPYPFQLDADNFTEALQRTTLYWKSFIVTDDKGEAVLSFYTNERTGKFSGVVQGVSTFGVFSAYVNFEVRK